MTGAWGGTTASMSLIMATNRLMHCRSKSTSYRHLEANRFGRCVIFLHVQRGRGLCPINHWVSPVLCNGLEVFSVRLGSVVPAPALSALLVGLGNTG